MSVVTDLVSKVLGGGQQSGLGQQISALLENKEGGGLAGLIAQFKASGLDQVVQSWISKNKNQPISGEQLQVALGSDRVKQIAAKLGIDPKEASAQLAKVLPDAVDQATPEGKLPSEAELNEYLSRFKVGT